MNINRRLKRNYLPEPRFQLKFMRFCLVASLVQLIVFCAILYYFVAGIYGRISPAFRATLTTEMQGLFTPILVVFALYLVTVAGLALLFSHRVGGAIYALKRTIYEINDGKDAELKLRKDDEFQEVADAFNLMVRNLKSGKIRRLA